MMADSSGATLGSLNRDKWENFEEESGEISEHRIEISGGRQEPNSLPEHRESISEQKAVRQQSNSPLNRKSGIAGTQRRENLEDRSKDLKEIPLKTHPSLSFQEQIDPSSSSEKDVGVIVERESVLQSSEGGLTAPSQSKKLSAIEADGVKRQVNGETGSEPLFHLSSSPAACHTTKEIVGNNATIPQWTTFEDSQEKDAPKVTETAQKEKVELLSNTDGENVENHTPLPLNAATSKMAAFDSRQPAVTTNIIPNLSAVTEPKAVKTNSLSLKGAANVSNNAANMESTVKSAVSIVENNSAQPNPASIATHRRQQSPETSNQSRENSKLAKNWVSFGEEGSSNLSKQKSVLGASTSGSDIGNLETAESTLTNSDRASAGNNATTQVFSAVNSQAEMKSTSVMAPVSFTSAELDLLASKSWIKFDESNKANHVQHSAADSWVKFGDSNVPVGQNLALLELDVGSKAKTSSAPSPNPFILDTVPSGGNPFKPPASNPFQADDTMAASASPYPTVNQGPISASSPVVGAEPLLVAEGVNAIQLRASQQIPVISNSVFPASSGDKHKPNQDQVDAGEAIADNKRENLQETNEILPEEKAVTSGSWSMLLRFPDKKRKIGSREWKPVVIKLEGTTLQIFEEYELSAPFREIPLQAYFVMTAPRLQSFEHRPKVHTIKLEYVKYTEGRSLRHRGTVEHIAQGTPIIKVASPSHTVIRELLEVFNNSLRLLPAYRDRGITYRHDEVFVDVDDVTYVLMSGDGTVVRKSSKVLIKFKAFLTGDPECQLVLNDVLVREREEARLRGELKPQRVHHWVKLQHCDFHKCVNTATFEQSHAITFHPLDACTFELMRFPVDHHKPLPLLVKTKLNIHSEQRVELKAEIQVCQETKMAKYVRSNVVFRFPIPESWVSLFRTSKVFRGEKSIKSSRGRHSAGIKSRLKHSKCSIGVSLGRAMYEPEYGSVVWRIDELPFIHSKIPADAPQTLSVVLDLPPGMEFPESYKPIAELEYDVAYVLVSDTTVIAVKVSNQNIPDKWVCYRALYQYDVNIEISRPSSGPVRDVGCTQQ